MPRQEVSTFVCLDDPDIKRFVQQDFSLIADRTTSKLRISDHELTVCKDLEQGLKYTIAIRNRNSGQLTVTVIADAGAVPPIATRRRKPSSWVTANTPEKPARIPRRARHRKTFKIKRRPAGAVLLSTGSSAKGTATSYSRGLWSIVRTTLRLTRPKSDTLRPVAFRM